MSFSPLARETRTVPTIATRAQAISAGITLDAIRAHLDSGRWQAFHHGIYVMHSGSLTRPELIDCVLLAAGDGAALSHHTAAELASLTDRITPTVHVTIPGHRRIARIHGAKIHHSNRLDVARHPLKRPAQTRIEETVFDLTETSDRVDEAVAWLAAACGRRLTTPARLAMALEQRQRVRWRRDLAEALGDIAVGNHSVLELRYCRTVERAHGLPAGQRQAPHQRSGGQIFDDVWYPDFHTVVELDGRVAHPASAIFRDLRRDNIAATRGDVVLHYGWADVTTYPCAVAAQVGAALHRAGWTGTPRRCGNKCLIKLVGSVEGAITPLTLPTKRKRAS